MPVAPDPLCASGEYERAYELVHFNRGVGRAALDDPRMAGFLERSQAVNRLAVAAPGFVWTPSAAEACDIVSVFGNPRPTPSRSKHISRRRAATARREVRG
jgi:hypothetical protein